LLHTTYKATQNEPLAFFLNGDTFKIYLNRGYTSNLDYLESSSEAARLLRGVKLKLLLKLGENLYCLRLTIVELDNGYTQSDMQLRTTTVLSKPGQPQFLLT